MTDTGLNTEHFEANPTSSGNGVEMVWTPEKIAPEPRLTDATNHSEVPPSIPLEIETKQLAPSVAGDSNPTLYQKRLEKARKTVEYFAESNFFIGLMSVYTIWALYNDDIRLAGTTKEADLGFEVVISIGFFLFLFEIAASSFYKPDYLWLPKWEQQPDETMFACWIRRAQFGSFYFWLDWIATLSLILEIHWIIGDSVNGGSNVQSTSGGAGARAGARAGRIVRLVRMVRLVRLVKLYKYGTNANDKLNELKSINSADQAQAVVTASTDMPKESHVGAAMSDLTNRRVIVLVLMMLIIIPVLTVNDPDTSKIVAVQIIGALAALNWADTSVPPLYESGLSLAINQTMSRLDVLEIRFNDVAYFINEAAIDRRRGVERLEYEDTSYPGFTTLVTFDNRESSIQGALYSIYTTSFIIVLLIGGTYFFSADVNRLVINPIERLVELVQKISANPLGVEYKMLGADEGFVDGMETTVLLATITKIGGLMRVGFGEAGATVIARNMSNGTGKLDLMGKGELIKSIFGFCDVRQFTDTTECLQEEVMLFVNRIAHILHSIVVQCSGAANKNIGDAFLLTWKVDSKYSEEQVSALADQALLAFCKALIELSRYQDFITNFTVAATARLYKRFPEYNVRIGSGLHFGWAVEGAIGSNRKIDASYLSPHVNTTEFLESSTKAYGVPLLLSEPFFKLLSPIAAKYCRKVDRIRRSPKEDPMCLYAYDSDLNINWNDPTRHNKKDAKSRLAAAAKRITQANQHIRSNGALPTIHSVENATSTTGSAATVDARKKSRDTIHDGTHPLPLNAPPKQGGRRTSTAGLPLNIQGKSHGARLQDAITESADEEKDEEAALKAVNDRRTEAPVIVVHPYTQNVWTDDSDIVELRHQVSDAFREKFETGMDAYIAGDWAKATEVFTETLRLSRDKDGPSKHMLEVIEHDGKVAPADWPGYRDESGGH